VGSGEIRRAQTSVSSTAQGQWPFEPRPAHITRRHYVPGSIHTLPYGGNIMATSTIAGHGVTANGILGGPPPPTISDFEPHHGEARSLVTIFGTNLSSVTLVQFNGFDAKISPDGNDSEIVVTVPDLATTGHIVISDGTNRVTSADVFMVDPPRPEVNTVTPAAAVPGTTLTFTGRHLATVNSVVFNCTNGSFSAAPLGLMPKTFKAVVPQNAGPGPARIVITNPFGTTAINFKVKR
jgi:hypothetical protein